MAGRGTAYRMGGDEFCAMWTRSDVGQASATTHGSSGGALEHGEAFAIGCSYGSVLLPEEATDIDRGAGDRGPANVHPKGHRAGSAGRRAPTSC